MDIIDKNLLRIIKVKLCTENIKNIEEIDDISIQDVNLMQKRLNINLKEIAKLKGLRNISLKFFEITDDVIDALNKLNLLKKLEFYMCPFNTSKSINKNLKDVTIYNSNGFNTKILEKCSNLESLSIIHSGLVDINNLYAFKSLRYLKIANCSAINIPNISKLIKLQALALNEIEIQNDIDISKMNELEFISLNGSNLANKNEYIERLKTQNKNIEIEFREDNLPIE